MQDTTKVQSEQESLEVIQRVAGKTPPSQVEGETAAASGLSVDEVALPELTDEFSSKKKIRRSIPFQFVFLGTFVVGILSVVRGCSTMNQSNANSPKEGAVASAPLAKSERQELLDVINDQSLAIQELKQGQRINVRTGKTGKLPKPPVNPKTVQAVTRTPVRRPASPPPQPASPKVVYKDRVVYKEAPEPAKQPVAKEPEQKPLSRISLTQKLQPKAPKPTTLGRSSRPTASARRPKLKGSESGTLVASSAMTGDLMKDMSTGNGQKEVTPQSPTPDNSDSVSAGTKVKAALANPLTWAAGNEEQQKGQRVLLRLKEDLGGFAPKDSMAIGQVTSVQGDFAQVQIVEINGQPLEHVNLRAPEGSIVRSQPVAIVQYKDTPYLQAKAKNSGGPGMGDQLLRAGLNMGVDQLRSQGVDSRATNVVNSLLPDRQNSFNQGSSIFAFEGKDVEIYFLEDV